MSTAQTDESTGPRVGSNAELGVAPERASIWERRVLLDKERREFMRQAMIDFDHEHYAKLRVLQAECGAEGHMWRFTNLGPLGHPWFACTKCNKSEVRTAGDCND